MTPPKLTPEQKANWNKFIDFVQAQRMSNMNVLDQRNKQIGMTLLQKYNMSNPKQTLPIDIVPTVQGELQNYRNDLVNQWKAGKVQGDGIKTENDIMPNISPVDGWPGSKTLTSKFPLAQAVTPTPAGTQVTKAYGTDTDAFDKDNSLVKNN